MKIAALLVDLPDQRTRDGFYTVGEIVFLVFAGICAGEKDITRIAERGYVIPFTDQ